MPVKQAVISASALSLLYPPEPLPDYARESFLEDLVREAEADIRGCLAKGAHIVQIDFTEGRLAVKLDPSRQLLAAFIDLNNRVLRRFSAEEQMRIGVHTCPGGDQDSTHSVPDMSWNDAEADYPLAGIATGQSFSSAAAAPVDSLAPRLQSTQRSGGWPGDVKMTTTIGKFSLWAIAILVALVILALLLWGR